MHYSILTKLLLNYIEICLSNENMFLFQIMINIINKLSPSLELGFQTHYDSWFMCKQVDESQNVGSHFSLPLDKTGQLLWLL